jgi:hypothetical protein
MWPKRTSLPFATIAEPPHLLIVDEAAVGQAEIG